MLLPCFPSFNWKFNKPIKREIDLWHKNIPASRTSSFITFGAAGATVQFSYHIRIYVLNQFVSGLYSEMNAMDFTISGC